MYDPDSPRTPEYFKDAARLMLQSKAWRQADWGWQHPTRQLLGAPTGLCHYCGLLSASTWDHVIPQSWAPLHVGANLRPACKSCNSSKGNRMPSAWLESLARRNDLPRFAQAVLANSRRILDTEGIVMWDLGQEYRDLAEYPLAGSYVEDLEAEYRREMVTS